MERKDVSLLLSWPVYLALFFLSERLIPAESCTLIWCPLDDRIPFCEWFLIPYVSWYVLIAGSLVWFLWKDRAQFRWLQSYILITQVIGIFCFFLLPSRQALRPETFPRDNLLTRFMIGFYQFDTNTNVFPSLHVIGAVAGMLGFCDTKYFRSAGWKIGNVIVTVLISMSTVYLKQHSILDVFGAIPVCLVAWYAAYCPGNVFGKLFCRSTWQRRKA